MEAERLGRALAAELAHPEAKLHRRLPRRAEEAGGSGRPAGSGRAGGTRLEQQVRVRVALLRVEPERAGQRLAVADVAYYYYPLAYDSTWNVGHWLIALAAVLPPSLTLRVPPLRMIRSGALPYTAAAGMAVFTAFELQHENAVDLLLTCVAALGLVVVKQIVALRQALAIQRQETAFREAVLETQSDLGLAMVILEGRKVIFANKAAEQLTGRHASELSGMPSVQGLAFEADREDWDAWLAVPSGPDDARLARPDGTVLEIEVVARWMHSAGDPRLLVVARDVTARRQAEAVSYTHLTLPTSDLV